MSYKKKPLIFTPWDPIDYKSTLASQQAQNKGRLGSPIPKKRPQAATPQPTTPVRLPSIDQGQSPTLHRTESRVVVEPSAGFSPDGVKRYNFDSMNSTKPETRLADALTIVLKMLETNEALGKLLTPQEVSLLQNVSSFIPEMSPKHRKMAYTDAMKHMLQYSMDCASIGLNNREALLQQMSEEIGAFLGTTGASVWLADPIVDRIRCGRIDMSLTGNAEHRIVRCYNEDVVTREDNVTCFPVGTKEGNLGVVEVTGAREVIGREKEVMDSVMEGMLSMSAITLRNLNMYKDLEFQREKAEAALQMANRLTKDIQDENILVRSIMEVAQDITQADRCSVFLVKDTELQAYLADGNVLTIPLGKGIAGHVAQHHTILNIPNAYEDVRFNKEIDRTTGYHTQSILCVPVLHEGILYGVAQLINKKSGHPFTKRDEELIMMITPFIAVCLKHCRSSSRMVREALKLEKLHANSKAICDSNLCDVSSVTTQIVTSVKDLVDMDWVTVYTIDRQTGHLYSKLSDSNELRFPVGVGIAGRAAKNGAIESVANVNLNDHYDPEFDGAIVKDATSLLSIPLHHNGIVIGVMQCINRRSEDGRNNVIPFTLDDSTLLTQFSAVVAPLLSTALLLQESSRTQKDALSLVENLSLRNDDPTFIIENPKFIPVGDLLSGDAPEETVEMLTSKSFDTLSLRYQSADPLPNCIAHTIQLFMKTGLPAQFSASEDLVSTFVVASAKQHLELPYNNMFRSLDALQSAHAFLKHGGASALLSPLEQYAFLVASFLLRVGHEGVNNTHQYYTGMDLEESLPLDGSYGARELRHARVAIDILRRSDCNIFGVRLREAVPLVVTCIMSVNPAGADDVSKRFAQLCETGFDEGDLRHRNVLLSALSLAVANNNFLKSYTVHRSWMSLLAQERAQLGIEEGGFSRGHLSSKLQHDHVMPVTNAILEKVCKMDGFTLFSNLAALLPGMEWCVDAVMHCEMEWEKHLSIISPNASFIGTNPFH